jgi:hypothetical protein
VLIGFFTDVSEELVADLFWVAEEEEEEEKKKQEEEEEKPIYMKGFQRTVIPQPFISQY